MKKYFPLIVLSLFIWSGCSKKQTAVPSSGKTGSVSNGTVQKSGDSFNFVNSGDPFALDYTPVTPEPKKPAGKINMSAGTSSGKSGASAKNESVIPGLRKLNSYQTVYYEGKTVSSQKKSSATEEKLDPSKAPKEYFTVTDWGPQGGIPADVKTPSFYVLFSEPVVPVKALEDPVTSSDLMTITPPLKGVFRWYGTSLLSFDASESADPLQTYTITLSDKITSLYGKRLYGDKVFKTEAQALEVESFRPGYNYSVANYTWFDKEDVPYEAAKECRVTFNYDVKADVIADLSQVLVAGNMAKFSVVQDSADTVTFKVPVPKDIKDSSAIKITVRQPNGAKGDPCEIKYNVLKPFSVSYVSAGETNTRFSNPVYISFSHMVDEATVAGQIRTEPEMKITSDNIEIRGTSVTVYNLPVTFGEEYKLKIADGIKDIYGRKLKAGKNVTIKVPDAASEVHFSNYGMKILESQFPHKMVFDYQNIEADSRYKLSRTKKPFTTVTFPSEGEIIKELSREPRNERILEEVDFNQVLEGDKGWVAFDALVKIKGYNGGTPYERKNRVSVQVTDLGVTVRYGINKVVALVTRLSDGSPVEGAEVYWFSEAKEEIEKDEMKKRALCEGKTDKNGLAVLNTEMKSIQRPAILVEKDDDAVTFVPESHSPWRNGIYNVNSCDSALSPSQQTFIFCDRGLYKPGETVSFRGIDRSLLMGEYIPYEGEYTVKLKEDGWYNSATVSTLTGKTSKSGGFYGTFTIPENTEPGIYKIAYTRNNSNNSEKYITINVAYFERLKFQASVSIPSVPLTTGDTVQGTLAASYLAGGALSGADYDSAWVREPWYFETDSPEFKDFRFGPVDANGGRSFISDDRGTLSADGEAKLSVTASPGDLKGIPYRYRVSANVTDASNMTISAQSATVVHPALYYIGLSRPTGLTGFAKSGVAVSFPFKLSDLEGQAVKNASDSAKLIASLTGENKNLNVTLSREYWSLVQQNGLYGGIYTRYDKQIEVEETKTIPVSSDGQISVTPKKTGYYILKVEGADAKGRPVISEYRFFVTGRGVPRWNQTDASSIRLTPDQSKYNPGDTAHILLESTLPSGKYLITVERDGIYTEEVRDLDEGIAVLDIPVANNYVPVVYVSVSSYSVRSGKPTHKYGEVDLDKPKGYYGVTELFVDPYVKAFSIDVKSEKSAYRPGEEATVTLTATRGGKPVPNAELTLMAADRGVLDLINYHVPDPISFFYDRGKFPLKVHGGDSRAYLMDPVTYEVKNLQGGDEGGDKLQERSDFNPTAVFEPVLVTDEKGQVTCKFKLPDTLTTYRVTAFGVCGDLLALQEDEIGVRNPVNVQQVLPRRMRERDTAELGVLITNLDSVSHKMKVQLELKTPDQKEVAVEKGLAPLPGAALVDGPSEHEVNVLPGQNVTVYFDAAAVKAGVVNVEFTVTSDVVNERIKVPLIIEKPYLYETFTSMGTIGTDESTGQEGLILPESVDNMGGLTVTLDATRLGALGDSVNYVFSYPYGCMEQQSARILPLVIFEDYIDVFGLDSKVQDIRTVVKSYFKNWSKVQMRNGGFGYWPDEVRHANIYVSLRIAYIGALAKERGYSDSEIAFDLKKLMNFLEGQMKSSNWVSDYEKVMYNYVRSMLGMSVSKTDLESQLAKYDDISMVALTGLTYLNMNGMESDLAEQCRIKIRKYMRPGTRGVDISQDSDWWWSWYNNNTDRMALALKFFTRMNHDDEMVTRLIWTLLKNQEKGYWTSTATTANVLDAFYAVIKTSGLDGLDQKARACVAGTEIASGTFKGPAAKPVTVTVPFKDPRLSKLEKDKLISVDFEKEGNGSLYYTTSLRYAIPYENQNARDEGLGVSMCITDLITGEEIKTKPGSALMELENGRVYSVKITLSTTRDRDFIAMRAPVPSGAEILDATFVTTPSDDSGSSYRNDMDYDWYDYDYDCYSHYMSNQAIYDNEIQFFWDHFRKGSTTAEFKFRAVRRGVYPTPPVTSECMYEPEVFGRSNGILFTIK